MMASVAALIRMWRAGTDVTLLSGQVEAAGTKLPKHVLALDSQAAE